MLKQIDSQALLLGDSCCPYHDTTSSSLLYDRLMIDSDWNEAMVGRSLVWSSASFWKREKAKKGEKKNIYEKSEMIFFLPSCKKSVKLKWI